jgi:glycosyltransferase involved in cell wall biosynthesis
VKPLRIALVHPFSWPDVRRGGERYVDDLARHLGRAGHTVEVLTGTSGEPSVEELDESPGSVRIRRLRLRPSARLERRSITTVETFGLLVLPHLVRRRFDVVHALTPTAALASLAARQRTVFTLLGHPGPQHLEGTALRRRTLRRAVTRATVVAALSGASADACRELFGRSAVVLPPGVRLDRFAPSLAPRTGPARVLLSADASDRRKGLDHLLGAFAHVLERRPDARLQISSAGDHRWALETLGPDGGRVADAIDALGAGSLEDVPRRYRDATISVLPSRAEAFGMVLVESLASGTPVVCNADGGMPEIVSDPAVGRVANADDPDAFATAMLEAIDLAAEAATPKRCVQHAELWDWERAICPAHEAIYRQALAGQRS